jgi:hypothetical protein
MVQSHDVRSFDLKIKLLNTLKFISKSPRNFLLQDKLHLRHNNSSANGNFLTDVNTFAHDV